MIDLDCGCHADFGYKCLGCNRTFCSAGAGEKQTKHALSHIAKCPSRMEIDPKTGHVLTVAEKEMGLSGVGKINATRIFTEKLSS